MDTEPTFKLSAIRLAITRERKEIEDAQERLDKARVRLDDWLLAENLLLRLSGQKVVTTDSRRDIAEQDSSEDKASDTPYRPHTNKDYFFRALRDSGEVWMTANLVQEEASKLKGEDIPMSSVSPGLTEMKDDGHIERVGLKVALKYRLKENGEAEASPDAEGVAAPSYDVTDDFHGL